MKPNVVLPDYRVAAILLPSHISGSMIGNQILKVLPPNAVSIMNTIVLIAIGC